jgi:hypothetical protein
MKHIEKYYKGFHFLYNDQSNPKIPSRNIRWEFTIPFFLHLEGSLFWPGHSFNIRFLIFGFHYITDVHCGKYVRTGFRKWFCFFEVFYGWNAGISIGVSQTEFMSWKIRRLASKLSPERKAEIREILKPLLDDIKKES